MILLEKIKKLMGHKNVLKSLTLKELYEMQIRLESRMNQIRTEIEKIESAKKKKFEKGIGADKFYKKILATEIMGLETEAKLKSESFLMAKKEYQLITNLLTVKNLEEELINTPLWDKVASAPEKKEKFDGNNMDDIVDESTESLMYMWAEVEAGNLDVENYLKNQMDVNEQERLSKEHVDKDGMQISLEYQECKEKLSTSKNDDISKPFDTIFNNVGNKNDIAGTNHESKNKDCVNFTLTSPSQMAPGNDYEIAVWAHLEEQQQEMLAYAKELHETDDISKKSKKSVPIERKTLITVFLDIPAFEIDDSKDTIYWDGRIANATFMVNVPVNLPYGQYKGKLLFLIEGLQIAKLDFKLTVGTEDRSALKVPANLIIINRAFASYASLDRDAVLARIHGIQKINPNIDVFIDLVSLHSGENWYKRIKEEIDSRDIFYLFWSEAASKSQWVEKEWRIALESKGIEFISPIPLVSPEKVKPPRELESRHFNDWILAYMKDN